MKAHLLVLAAFSFLSSVLCELAHAEPVQQIGMVQYRVLLNSKKIEYWKPIAIQQLLLDGGDGESYFYQVELSLSPNPFESEIDALKAKYPGYQVVPGWSRSIAKVEFDAGLGIRNFNVSLGSVPNTTNPLETSDMVLITREQYQTMLDNKKHGRSPRFKVRVATTEEKLATKLDVSVPVWKLCSALKGDGEPINGAQAVLRLSGIDKGFSQSVPLKTSREQILKAAIEECLEIVPKHIMNANEPLSLSRLRLAFKDPVQTSISVSSTGETVTTRVAVQNEALVQLKPLEVTQP